MVHPSYRTLGEALGELERSRANGNDRASIEGALSGLLRRRWATGSLLKLREALGLVAGYRAIIAEDREVDVCAVRADARARTAVDLLAWHDELVTKSILPSDEARSRANARAATGPRRRGKAGRPGR